MTLSLYGAKLKWAISHNTNAQVRVCVIRCVARAYIASKRARVVHNDCHGARAGKRKREAVCDGTSPRKNAMWFPFTSFSTEARMIVASMCVVYLEGKLAPSLQ